MVTDGVSPERDSIAAEPCNCKTTCSRKTTAKSRGCPCKTAKVHCTELCSCGMKRKSCQNKQRNQVTSEFGSIVRPTEEDERVLENRRMKEFIGTLDEQMVRELCTRALSKGVGSMEYVDSLLIIQDDDDDENNAFENDDDCSEESVGSGGPPNLHTELTPDWCKCRQCQPMAQEIENKCCGSRNCITFRRRFEKLCLDAEVLELCIKNRADVRNDREDNSTSSLRRAAYRQFISDRYGYLGKENRKVAPSCVVLGVRRQYPSATGIYIGFRPE